MSELGSGLVIIVTKIKPQQITKKHTYQSISSIFIEIGMTARLCGTSFQTH